MRKPFRDLGLKFTTICARTASDLLDSADCAADTSCIDRSCARTRFSSYARRGELWSLGGDYESHVSRACARVVGLGWLSDHESKLRPGLWQLMWLVWSRL